MNEPITHIVRSPGDSRQARILHGGQGTSCNSGPGICGQLQPSLIANERASIDEIQINLCRLRGVACLNMARIIAMNRLY